MSSEVKREWYDLPASATCVIDMGYVREADSSVTSSETGVAVAFKTLDGKEYALQLNLAAPIVPEETAVDYQDTSVRIKLKKKTPGPWTAFEAEK